MTEAKIREIALSLICNNQSSIEIKADRKDLLYGMAYNDGVLEFLQKLEGEFSKSKDEVETEKEDWTR